MTLMDPNIGDSSTFLFSCLWKIYVGDVCHLIQFLYKIS